MSSDGPSRNVEAEEEPTRVDNVGEESLSSESTTMDTPTSVVTEGETSRDQPDGTDTPDNSQSSSSTSKPNIESSVETKAAEVSTNTVWQPGDLVW